MQQVIRIGTRESQLATWQARQVQQLLTNIHVPSELVFIKSEGDIDLKTPLYEMGVQGIFTRSLDIALLNNQIDVAVHSMKDVPTQLPQGILQAAVLPRGPVHDLLVYKTDQSFMSNEIAGNIATSSTRRKAQWLNRFPNHTIHNLRGNVNTRLRKLSEESWDAAIFAQAGLERIGVRPANSVVIDWMLPAPAQGAILVASRLGDDFTLEACSSFNDRDTTLCTKIEKDFLRSLFGGCTTPIGGLAQIRGEFVYFKGNMLSVDGSQIATVEQSAALEQASNLGVEAAHEILLNGGREIAAGIQHA